MDTISGVWAGAVELFGQIDLERVAMQVGGWPALARASLDDLRRAGVPPDRARRWMQTPPSNTRGRALTRCCPGYPSALLALPAPPPVVFVEGDVAALGAPAVAIVGTRKCTPYGASAAHRIAHACARASITVVSGLARGIDAAAHRGSLAGPGRTIAVLGHGLGYTSPPSNRPLRDRIVAEGGLLISTWPDARPPERYTFPLRNRWIAALSRRIVIVEAPDKSGALITAQEALEQGRDHDLWIVPGPLSASTWRGSAALLSWGVRPLVDLDAFLEDLAGGPSGDRWPEWITALFSGATLDEVASLREVTSVQLMREIARLELAGRLVRLPGGRYAASGGSP